jgi:hypothetical protein
VKPSFSDKERRLTSWARCWKRKLVEKASCASAALVLALWFCGGQLADVGEAGGEPKMGPSGSASPESVDGVPEEYCRSWSSKRLSRRGRAWDMDLVCSSPLAMSPEPRSTGGACFLQLAAITSGNSRMRFVAVMRESTRSPTEARAKWGAARSRELLATAKRW